MKGWKLFGFVIFLSLFLAACGAGGGDDGLVGGGGDFTPPPGSSASGGPIATGGTLTVNVTDYNSGASLSGVTVIVDHPVDGRQVDTTASAVTFIITNGGPVTVTVAKSGYEIVTYINIDATTLNIALDPRGISAFVEGTASNFIGPNGNVRAAVFTGRFSGGDLEFGPTTEDLDNGTIGFYRLWTRRPNRLYAVSAFDFGSGSVPLNFAAVTGIGPLSDGLTLTGNLIFPVTPPATTNTTGTITVPASVGTIAEVGAGGFRDLGDQGELTVGISPTGTTSPYAYNLSTFPFTEGISDDLVAYATGTPDGLTVSIHRGVGFGGTEDFTLIDIATNLSPAGGAPCGGIAPTFSWTGVTAASFYYVNIEDSDTDWTVVVDGGSTSFTLPDLTGTPVEALGLSPGDPVDDWEIIGIAVPGFDFDNFDDDTMRRIFTDTTESRHVICTL